VQSSFLTGIFIVAPEAVWQVGQPPYQSEIWYGSGIPFRWNLANWFFGKSL